MDRIWLQEKNGDRYAEFCQTFRYCGGEGRLRVGADRQYAAFLNGKLVCGAQYADSRPRMDETDVTAYLQKGKNVLTVLAYHAEEDYSVAYTREAGVAFEVTVGGKPIAVSGESTLCRAAQGYRTGDLITPQLGLGYSYDFSDPPGAWGKCRIVEKNCTDALRPVARCNVGDPLPSEVCAQGIFRYRGGETAAQRAQTAWMSTLRFFDMTGKERLSGAAFQAPIVFHGEGGDGVFVLVDLKAEYAGYLTFDVWTERPCRAILAWGEHLADLRVRAAVGTRNFAVALNFVAGENRLDEYLHRAGCRYLCLFAECDEITVRRLSLMPAEYPFRTLPKTFGDRLFEKIYRVGERTLRLCAHEHYEDCPWREQALYGMDSRNQMLFGYGVFGEYELPRAALRLMAGSIREDGLIELCAPARAPITIPSFSAYWLLALAENAEADLCPEFLREMFPYAEKIVGAFKRRTGERGIYAFHEPRYWNFHEWSAGLDGGEIFRSREIGLYYDGVLTALVLYAAQKLEKTALRIDDRRFAGELQEYRERLAACLENYYLSGTGLYASFLKAGKAEGCHAYTQALFLLTGCVPEERKARLLAELKAPSVSVPFTLASLPMKYDAVLETDGDKKYCVDDVCAIFAPMLFSGATSYWETENGEADFEDAGSLCHGWSAVACYVFDRCGVAK